MAFIQPEPVVEKQSAASLIEEQTKADTHTLKCKIPCNVTVPTPQKRYLCCDDIFSHFTISGVPATVVFPLSNSVRTMLDIGTIRDNDLPTTLARSPARLLRKGERAKHASFFNIKVSSTIIAKVRPFPPQEEKTEYISMKYLDEQLSALPLPKPYYLIHTRKMAYLFMSYTAKRLLLDYRHH